jgi:hypothetical protein
VHPVAVPTHRRELTRREEWRLRWLPAFGRVIAVALVFAVLGVQVCPRADAIIESLPWHPWGEHRWLSCTYNGTHFAIYSQHPRGFCDFAARAPLDCAATCETPVGHASWEICEERCPAERRARISSSPVTWRQR